MANYQDDLEYLKLQEIKKQLEAEIPSHVLEIEKMEAELADANEENKGDLELEIQEAKNILEKAEIALDDTINEMTQIEREYENAAEPAGMVKELAPEAEVPAAPEAEVPAAPEAEVPAAPEAEVPAAPEAEVPAAPEAEVPTTPEAEVPTTPEAEVPAAPEGVKKKPTAEDLAALEALLAETRETISEADAIVVRMNEQIEKPVSNN